MTFDPTYTLNDDFRILTKGDRNRILTSLVTLALSLESGAALRNSALAWMLGVSPYHIAKHRKTMAALGTLGVIKGHALPALPRVPETTWNRFHAALADAQGVLCLAHEDGLNTPTLGSLTAIVRVAMEMASSKSVELYAVANAVDMLDDLTRLVADEILSAEHLPTMTGTPALRHPAVQ